MWDKNIIFILKETINVNLIINWDKQMIEEIGTFSNQIIDILSSENSND